MTLGPFETVETKGILRKTPNHYKRMNVMVNDLGGRRSYKDIAVVSQLQILKPGSDRISIVLRNLTSRTLKLKKGINVAHVEASQVVPLFDEPLEKGKVCEEVTENINRESQSEDLTKKRGKRMSKILEKIDLTGIESWTEQQQYSVKKLLEEYQHLFALNLKELGKTSLVQHEIKLSNNTPFKERYRRIPLHQYEEVRKHLQEMLDIGAICRSTSPWASPVVLVCKKDGSLQFCIDLRKLNNQTIKDAQSLPRIEDSLDCLDGAAIFTSLDLQSGYWQVEMTEDSKPLTAFTVGPLGFYECVQMPFGLTNALATFQHLMETCLGEMHLKWCIIYLDDIIVFSKTPEEHIERLRGMFEKLAAAGLRLKPSKCEFFKSQVTYLGHIVSKDGIETDPKKIEAIKNWPVPKTVTEVRSFLGFMNYYRKFIPKYAQVARPINQLVSGENANKKKALVDWTEECQIAFEHLKHLCNQTPILAYANYTKPFKLHTDASENGLGAILYQKQDDGMEHVIAYASRTLSKSEQNYDAHKLEFLALKWSITERFHEYLYGRHFEVYTDNNPLTYILTTAKLDATGQRWVVSLANHNFKIFYRSGKLNVEVDALLCIPWESTQVENVEPLIVKTMLQSKMESEISFPEKHFPEKLLLKSMTVDTTLKLTQKDWIKEQMDDVDINKIVQF